MERIGQAKKLVSVAASQLAIGRSEPEWTIVPTSSALRSTWVVLFAALVLSSIPARSLRAEPAPPSIFSPPVSLSHHCGLLGDCARSDAIGLHLGTNSAMRFTGSRRFVGLSGWVHGSLTFLDLVTIGGALGGHFGRDDAGSTHTASTPAIVFAKLRAYPFPWRSSNDGGLRVALSYQRAFVSERLGKDEPPGFDSNTIRLLASRSFGPVDLDGGVGVVFGSEAPDLRRYVEGGITVGLRLYGLVKPLSPDEQMQIFIQGLYRFSLPGSGAPSEGYVLIGVHERTTSGYGLGLGIGPQLLGTQVGGLFMLQFSVSWGLRYRNPVAESLASRPRFIPGLWMNLFYIDPVLESDGCVWTDPNPVIGRMEIKCIGKPDPKNPKIIILNDGRRFAAGTHLWIRDDGMLITQRLEEVAQLDKQTADSAIAMQLLGHTLHRAEAREGKPCKFKADLLHGVTDAGLAAVLAYDDFGGAAALLGTELARQVQCGERILSSGGFVPLIGKGLGKGPMQHRGSLPGQAHSGEVEHSPPASIKPMEQHRAELLAELGRNGTKHDSTKIVAIGRRGEGKIVFLEKGTSSAESPRPSGLAHILERHEADFARRGISADEIPDSVLKAVTEGKIVGYQGRDHGRPIYEVEIQGKVHRIAVTTGSNGYIVGANPAATE